MIETALLCLALNLYFEARGEDTFAGQLAVAEVTLNRVASEDYPNTVCEVVLQDNEQGCQFSWWCDGKSDTPAEPRAFQKSKALARMMLKDGEYITVVGKDAIHYHSTSVEPYWTPNLEKIEQIGNHVFYKKKDGMKPLARPADFVELLEESQVKQLLEEGRH
jgi:spore germination cell wall hydrolase CwlJ-like protein